MATGDNPLEVLFPLKGVDVSTEFELQPELTTPVGVNVRAYEPLTGRGRGGSRPGLVKYVAGQIPEGAELIQHLNSVVDPTIEALITTFNDFDTLPGGGIDDPSTNNGPIPRQPTPARRVRRGGSGIQPNRKVGADDQVPSPPWPPPPPPPPPPPTCETETLTFNLDPVFQNDFNGSVSLTASYCPCNSTTEYTYDIQSDLGGDNTNFHATGTDALDAAIANAAVLAVTGFADAVTSITNTPNGGECSSG